MREIAGVRAMPGGRVRVQFHDHGFVIRRDRLAGRVAEALLGDTAGCVTVLVLLASVGLYSLLNKAGAPHAVAVACLWVFLVAACYATLLALLRWAAEVVGNIVSFLLVVVTLPGLLIPGYRRKALRRWRGGGPESEPGWVPATALGGVWLGQEHPSTGAVVTVQFVDGSVVAYTTRPDRSRELRDGFEALLRVHRPVPTAVPHQQSAPGTTPYQSWHPGPPRS
ncbi:hypothetical protein [Streptomyces alanosinicus]|uniref:Uncharacterized protein n=1 Tax=Streptomyces alanosinicus TaxID=68171 RepID=A0A919D6X3_9ACTN|nr:hypothetical protein [Streptomyces alanosinicus]GHE15432.1 hypothetical protein GCM10010339_90110 [Streptomyces alanosinicus]